MPSGEGNWLLFEKIKRSAMVIWEQPIHLEVILG